MNGVLRATVGIAMKVLDGFDDRQLPRVSGLAGTNEPNVRIDGAALDRERRMRSSSANGSRSIRSCRPA
jgi:hypothetical protein